jgi:SAM-dependent methyltransferase
VHVADLPFPLPAPIASRLAAALDVEQKLPRALASLGPLAGRHVALLDVPDGVHTERLAAAGVEPRRLPLTDPLRLDLPDASLDALISLWSGFRGVDPEAVAEADRVLRPGGRLLVVHDYGRDDVSLLRRADAPEYTSWSRRDGPFLRDGLFRIRVLHCFWTFPSLEDAQGFLAEAFGEQGTAVASTLRRPRLSWNVAVYHRWQGGAAPADADPATPAPE